MLTPVYSVFVKVKCWGEKDDYCVMFLDSSRAILERKPHAYISNRRQKFNSSAANR